MLFFSKDIKEILELPGNLNSSELQFFTPNPDQALSTPKRLAWITGGVC